ncbi:MAG TPA: FAD-dependent oxidoreductase [Planctomycetaceae bacterium]|nr:FAD-dependent oxidoreductase [Planctomycetaceae bacterium]
MESKTPWQDVRMPKFATLEDDFKCDVLIIGGGITGLTAAYLLTKAGQRVCVVDRQRIGQGDTGCTTAHLTCVTDARLSELVNVFGRDGARLAWGGGAAAVNTIEEIVRAEEIKCEFRRVPGFLHASLDSERDESSDLQRDCRLAEEFEFPAVFLPSVPHIGKPGIRFANQAKFHPMRYVAGLARAVADEGGLIFEESTAGEFSEGPRAVKINGHRVECGKIVMATHVPLAGESGTIGATLLQTKLASYSTYAIGAKIPRDAVPEASFWDTSDPYYYLRIDHGEHSDYAIFGGQDHKTGQAGNVESRFAELESHLHRLIPKAKSDRRWSGQVVETHDGLPYIGESAQGQFVATGFAGNGMTFGTLGGMMACDWALDRKNPWRDLLSVNRKKLHGVFDFVKENLDYPYYLVRDRLAGTEARSTRSVKRGEGKVLTLEGQRVAGSRDDEGKVTCLSAVCTHMGCIVHWNAAEHTWDCPCHGSRFQATGEVLAGPAESPLERAEAPSSKAPVGNDGRSARRRSSVSKSRR